MISFFTEQLPPSARVPPSPGVTKPLTFSGQNAPSVSSGNQFITSCHSWVALSRRHCWNDSRFTFSFLNRAKCLKGLAGSAADCRRPPGSLRPSPSGCGFGNSLQLSAASVLLWCISSRASLPPPFVRRICRGEVHANAPPLAAPAFARLIRQVVQILEGCDLAGLKA